MELCPLTRLLSFSNIRRAATWCMRLLNKQCPHVHTQVPTYLVSDVKHGAKMPPPVGLLRAVQYTRLYRPQELHNVCISLIDADNWVEAKLQIFFSEWPVESLAAKGDGRAALYGKFGIPRIASLRAPSSSSSARGRPRVETNRIWSGSFQNIEFPHSD
jgi:hypothetical protein